MPRRAEVDDQSEVTTGTYGVKHVPVDQKGRVTIPSGYRSLYEDKIRGGWLAYLVADRQRIDVLNAKLWSQKLERIKNNNSLDPDDVMARRRMLVGTEIKMLDREGRLTLSPQMRKMTGIGSQAVIIWMEEWVELWSEQEFTKWLNSAPSMEELERKVFGKRAESEAPA